MNVDSKHAISLHGLKIFLLIFGARYLINLLIYINKLTTHGIQKLKSFTKVNANTTFFRYTHISITILD